jgi:hypothetical protein
VDQAEFFSHFKGWEEELQALISVCPTRRAHWIGTHR